jgi:hypothetical protein
VSALEPRWDILRGGQRGLWPSLAPSVQLGLVLYGGTAAAIRLGHRSSIDFDFFTEQPVEPEALQQHFDFLKSARVIQQQKNSYSVLTSPERGGVKVRFFGEIKMGRVGEPELTQDGVLRAASLVDLLATKLKVLLSRVEAKDYRDIAAIVRAGTKLEVGLAAAYSMYAPSFQPSEALKALTYFGGGDLSSLPAGDRELLTRAVGSVRKIPMLGVISRSLK